MFPSQFSYHKPGSVKEAVALLKSDPDAKIVAGGHSLIPAMKLRLAAPSALVDLGGIKELQGIDVNGSVRIGAMTTYAQLRDSAKLKKALPVIAEVANNVGDPQVQSRGTLGGSLAHNDPAADFTAVMLALGASVKVAGPSGERTIPVDDLLVDLLTTSLANDEIITEIVIPGGASAAAYEKFRHPASGYAVVGIAAAVRTGAGGVVEDARIAVTGCTSNSARARAAEAALVGKKLSAESIAAAAAVAADGLDLNGDHYASADYRRHLVGVCTRRALERLG
ncbi:MAG: FAD binding domain-containing protein [Chloroflexota bacterium]